MKMKKLLAIGLAATIISACTATAFAAPKGDMGGGMPSAPTNANQTKAVPPNDSGTSKPAAGQARGQGTDIFETLLTDGTISQTTYDAIRAYMEVNMPQKTETKEKTNILDTLLTAGIITQTEYDGLAAITPTTPTKPAAGTAPTVPTDIFTQAVTDDVISQTTADAITAYLEANRIDKTGRQDIYAAMLTAGVITQSEYDAIIAAMPTPAVK